MTQSPRLDTSAFRNNASVTLCFDLRDDRHPLAGLLLKPGTSQGPTAHSVALPFQSAAASADEEIYSRWGSYGDTTLITFTSSPNTTGTYGIGLLPIFPNAPEAWGDDPGPDDLDRSRSSIFYLAVPKSNLRQFIYKYPDVDRFRNDWLTAMSSVADTTIDRIAVLLPANAQGRPIHHQDRTVVPDATSSGPVRIFPGRATGLQPPVPAVQIRYELPETTRQEVLIEEVSKLLGALLPPGLALFILFFGTLNSPRQRLLWIGCLSLVQISVIAVFIYLASSSWSESTSKAVADLGIAFISASLAAFALWKDKKMRDAAAGGAAGMGGGARAPRG
ncbi:MAG TPA: hypothetical protein VHG32_18630 [Thermoanaerobaculia bacterium]|nr:hypothetical protein [Thermoanaerobaculia bacterium]